MQDTPSSDGLWSRVALPEQRHCATLDALATLLLEKKVLDRRMLDELLRPGRDAGLPLAEVA